MDKHDELRFDIERVDKHLMDEMGRITDMLYSNRKQLSKYDRDAYHGIRNFLAKESVDNGEKGEIN